jgi:hypothetical protein
MTNRIAKRKWFLLLASMLIGASVVTGSFRPARQVKSQKKQKRVTELPLVISHVPKLKIVSVVVQDAETSNQIAVVEILNTSPLAVTAVELSTKDKHGDSGAVGEDGLYDPDNPYVVIPPYGTKKMKMGFGAMIADAPLVLSAATFEDGSEEGDKWSLDAMKVFRKRYHEKKARERRANK